MVIPIDDESIGPARLSLKVYGTSCFDGTNGVISCLVSRQFGYVSFAFALTALRDLSWLHPKKSMI